MKNLILKSEKCSDLKEKKFQTGVRHNFSKKMKKKRNVIFILIHVKVINLFILLKV